MIELLRIMFLCLVGLIITYIVRHYVFTLTVLYRKKEQITPSETENRYEPKVTVLIPAHNEEHVI